MQQADGHGPDRSPEHEAILFAIQPPADTSPHGLLDGPNTEFTPPFEPIDFGLNPTKLVDGAVTVPTHDTRVSHVLHQLREVCPDEFGDLNKLAQKDRVRRFLDRTEQIPGAGRRKIANAIDLGLIADEALRAGAAINHLIAQALVQARDIMKGKVSQQEFLALQTEVVTLGLWPIIERYLVEHVGVPQLPKQNEGEH